MGWLRLDDAFGTHPKVAGLSDRAFRDHVLGMLYCAQHLTDGIVPTSMAPRRRSLDELAKAHLWFPIEGGWQIHDYLEYNPPRAEVLAEREYQRAQRSAAGKARAAGAQRDGGRFVGGDSQRVAGDSASNGYQPRPRPSPKSEPRERDPLHDTLAEVEGSDPLHLTPTRARTIGVALAEIRKASPDVTPDEIRRRASTYPAVMPPGTKLTAPALASHWSRCNGSKAGDMERAAKLAEANRLAESTRGSA